ncbi:ABC transporter ATP-binding protein [Sneathiella sp. CAU 1612]|jgi:putative hydroxymethylpyrimidine transport system ATP-binding protein|uniref:ABC transporter ATP-binding protein n=1 Tax=Sneathiella sedimenti TaxID=2816034 RepID=A0ABS3F9E2_9PROT|nr:ABC transporter ATP-binding protein [Sneathiella sedimenti]MBO0335083.1 ABC transporter ATP-binding protein [Sneathiella sedimenti]
MEPDNPTYSDAAESMPDVLHDQGEAGIGVDLSLDELVFDGDTILSDLNLELEPGKITCLLGPSGVGKSSILKILAGFIPLPGNSRVTTSDGKSLEGRLSYMDQKDLLLPWASVFDNLLIGNRLRGEIPDRVRADRLIKQVGLEKWRDSRPDTLSGGMRQRVALARTLMEGSSILLMDEPFSALDAITKFRLQGLAARLLTEKTVLLITHDPMEALRLGDVIYVLAGHPARLSEAIRPEKDIPRDPADDAFSQHYSAIMTRLAGETEDAS